MRMFLACLLISSALGAEPNPAATPESIKSVLAEWSAASQESALCKTTAAKLRSKAKIDADTFAKEFGVSHPEQVFLGPMSKGKLNNAHILDAMARADALDVKAKELQATAERRLAEANRLRADLRKAAPAAVPDPASPPAAAQTP